MLQVAVVVCGIFKESCLCKQHSAGSCVYPSRTVEVKASREEF